MVDKVKVICVGDQVERINGQNIVGTRHYEVARMLKELPKNKPFTLKLIEPMKAFGELSLKKDYAVTSDISVEHFVWQSVCKPPEILQ